MSAYTNSANVKIEAENYLRAYSDARQPQKMAATSAMSDAQAEMVFDQTTKANFLMNVAKFIVMMEADEVNAIVVGTRT